MKIMKLFLIIFTLIYQISSNNDNAGVKIAIADSGIKSVEDFILPKYLNEKNFHLDNITINQHIDFLGTVKLNVTDCNLLFHNISGDNIQVKFIENSNITVNIVNLTGSIDFKYVFKSGFYDNQGPGWINITNIELKMVNTLSSQPNALQPEKLSPAMQITELQIGDVKIDINFKNFGNLERIVKYLVINLQAIIMKNIKDKLLNEYVPKINEQVNFVLANIPLQQNIPSSNLTIDYSLMESPKVKGNILQISLNSSISSKINNITYDGPSKIMPDITTDSAPLIVLVNQYIFDSLSYTLFKENLTNAYIYSENSTMLNTYAISFAVPELYKHYDSVSKPVDLRLYGKNFPALNLFENASVFNIDQYVDFIVRVNDTYKEVAFTSEIQASTNFSVILSSGTFSAKLNSLKIDNFNVTESNIGVIDDKNIATNLNFFLSQFKQVIENTINKYLSNITIPTVSGISFNKTEIITHDGYIEFGINPIFINNTNSIDSFSEEFEKSLKFLE